MIELEEYSILKIAAQDGRFDTHIAMSIIKPREYVSIEEYAKRFIQLRHRIMDVQVEIQAEMRTLLLAEKDFNKSFIHKKKDFERKMALFMESQLAFRRQRSIAKEIISRRKRLIDLRDSRLAAIKSAYDKANEEMKKAVEAKKLADAYKPPKITTQVSLKLVFCAL